MQEKQDWAEGEVELECCNSLRQFYRGLWSWNSLGKVSQIEPDQTDMNPQALASHSAQATSRERVQTWVRQLHSADGISPKGTQLWVVSSHHCLSTMAALDSPQNYCMAPPCYSKPIVSLRMQLSWFFSGLCLFLGKLSRGQSLSYIRISAFAASHRNTLGTHYLSLLSISRYLLPLTPWWFTLIPKAPLVNMCFSGCSCSTYPFCIKII